MIIVADSGSTKTDWALVQEGSIRYYQGRGLNPYFLSEDEISKEIGRTLKSVVTYEVKGVYFYGAGTTSEENNKELSIVFKKLFPKAVDVVIDSDIAGAAKALFVNRAGIACILGTGANSCVYDGQKITERVRSLGYFLGDNGSGAVLGLRFLQLYLKNKLSGETAEEFRKEYGLDFDDIMDNVYRRSTPSEFFAKFSPFILEHIDEPVVNKVVRDEFREFAEYFVLGYKDARNLPVRMVGSIAFYYRHILEEVFSEYDLKIYRISKRPIEALAKYYSGIVNE